jgi:hypothetical protein
MNKKKTRITRTKGDAGKEKEKWACNFGPTCVTIVLAPTWLGRLQQDWRNPPHPPSTTPPPSQQNRKNSHEPVVHWLWSPTKNLSWLGGGGGGRRRRCCGTVKKNLSWLPQDSGLRPCLQGSQRWGHGPYRKWGKYFYPKWSKIIYK